MERQRRHARVALRLGGDALRIGFGAGRAARVVAGQGAHQRLPFEIVVGGEQLGPGLHVLAGVERLGDRQAEIRWGRQLHQTDAQQVPLRRQAGRERLGVLPRRRVMRPIRRFVADRVRVKPGFLPRHGGDIGRRHSRRRAVRRRGQLQDSGRKERRTQASLRGTEQSDSPKTIFQIRMIIAKRYQSERDRFPAAAPPVPPLAPATAPAPWRGAAPGQPVPAAKSAAATPRCARPIGPVSTRRRFAGARGRARRPPGFPPG